MAGKQGMRGFGTAARFAAVTVVAALLSGCAAAPDNATSGTRHDTTSTSLPGRFAGRPPDVKDLNGLKPDDVLAMLGQPDLRREEPPAEMWQYRTSDCVLSLFFYDDAGGYRLAHVEAWQRSLSASTMPSQCRDADAPIKAHFITQSAL